MRYKNPENHSILIRSKAKYTIPAKYKFIDLGANDCQGYFIYCNYFGAERFEQWYSRRGNFCYSVWSISRKKWI